MQTFKDVLDHFHDFLEESSYLEVLPCRWGEGDPINFSAVLCQTPEELYQVLANDLETELDLKCKDC